ncbi:TrmB family transcriptional regulator [Nanoarchaeota archaeon]
MEKTLEDVGLTKNQAKIYLALLDLGLSSAKPIIEKTKLHRQLVYNGLDFLIEKGLVSYVIQSNKKYFKAANPKQFLNYFKKKEEEIQKQKNKFKEILPKLKKKEKHKLKQEATVYYGNKGIKALLDNMIRENKKILTIGASDIKAKAFQYHLKFNLPLFHKIRVNKKIPLKILLSIGLKQRIKDLKKLKHTKTKILPKEFTSNSSTNIYGNKVSIIMWGEEPFGFLIESKDIVNAQRKHFNLLWRMAKS